MDAAKTMVAGTRRAYGLLPNSARRRVTNGLGRIRGRRLARENTELLNTVDLAVGGFEGRSECLRFDPTPACPLSDLRLLLSESD